MPRKMCLEKIKDLKVPIAIAIVAIISAIVTYLNLGNRPETIIAIATIALVAATVYIAYFNMKLWLAQDRPWLMFDMKHMDWAGGERTTWLFVTNVGRGPAFDVKFWIIDREYQYNSLTPGRGESIPQVTVTYPLPKDGIKIRDISYKDINNYRRSQDDQTVLS